MLTRLKVHGFKNLLNVDVRFGPFTCIGGANGVGKSNLFDAIQFLSLLADRTLLEAALAVRGGDRLSDLLSRSGDRRLDEMSFEAEMLLPPKGIDDLGQPATASSTFVRYKLVLGLRDPQSPREVERLAIIEESLGYIKKGDAHRHLLFDHEVRSWRNSVVVNHKYGKSFISMDGTGTDRRVRLHQDGGGSRGRPLSVLAETLLRTLVSSTNNAAESPTVLMARREMQSWRLLQLEPSALRRPDHFHDPVQIASNGAHLASTLHRLEYFGRLPGNIGEVAEDGVSPSPIDRAYAEVANRLAELIDDVDQVTVDRDEKRQLLTLEVTHRDGTVIPAAALSDGSLRLLALAILEIDPEEQGLLCLEEPENGVHSSRIWAMLEILRSIAVDSTEEVGPENPLRQVIFNTHSPLLVRQVPEDSLLVASAHELVDEEGGRWPGVDFRHLEGTWRGKAREAATVAPGVLLEILQSMQVSTEDLRRWRRLGGGRRVGDRQDVLGLTPLR